MEVIVAGSPTQIIGGYNPASWMSTDDFVTTPTEADRIAFIFNLISGTVLQQEAASDNGQYKSYNAASIGPVTGGERHLCRLRPRHRILLRLQLLHQPRAVLRSSHECPWQHRVSIRHRRRA
jgi:hypothetical protein